MALTEAEMLDAAYSSQFIGHLPIRIRLIIYGLSDAEVEQTVAYLAEYGLITQDEADEWKE